MKDYGEELLQRLIEIGSALETLPADAQPAAQRALAATRQLGRLANMVGHGGQPGNWDLNLALGQLSKIENLLGEHTEASGEGPIAAATAAAGSCRTLLQELRSEGKKRERRRALGEIEKPPRPNPTFSSPPTFILGNRRSGTTLLSWLLDSHPEITVVPENSLCHDLFSRKGADRVPGAGPKQPHLAAAQKSTERFGEGRDIFYGRVATLIDGVFSDYATRQGSRRWIAKDLILYDSLELLDLVFGYSARYICIFRHGLDVALSASQLLGSTFGTPSQGGDLDIKAFLEEWVENSEKTYDFAERNPERCHLVSYESLVTDATTKAPEIFRFLEEAWEPEIFENMQSQDHHPGLGNASILATGGKILANRRDRWREWPRPLLRQLGKIANPTLARLAYDTVEA